MDENKRRVEVVIASDIHLATYGSHAKEFKDYLDSIDPDMIILNGDIVDMWQFKKKYFPPDHMDVIMRILELANNGTEVYYLTGNHDDALRRFSDIQIGNIHLLDKLCLEIGGNDCWIFHGDVFDSSVTHSKWIAKLGGKGYDLLIRLNRMINLTRARFDKEPLSFSKKIKENIKKAVKFISDFEDTAINLAMENKYDIVVCGHIHQPVIKIIEEDGHTVTYMNSGDWVENLTTLEYLDGEWSIYHHFDAIKVLQFEKEIISEDQYQLA